MINKRSSEDGVALIFALAMLALLLIMLIGFLASSILEQRIAYSYRDDVGSKLLVRGALVHAKKLLENTTDDLLWMRNGSPDEKVIAPIVSINPGSSAQNNEPASTVLNSSQNPRYAYKALKPLLKKYFGPDDQPSGTQSVEDDWKWRNWLPDGEQMFYPEWIYYYQNSQSGSHGGRRDFLTGRMAYVIVPNLGINLNLLGDDTHTRKGEKFEELPRSAFLSNSGQTILTRFNKWLSPDILLSNIGLYSNSTNNGNFIFTQLDATENLFSGHLGGVLGTDDDPGNYREFATLFLTCDEQKFSHTGFNITSRSKTDNAQVALPAATDHGTWKTFVTNNFSMSAVQADQVAANIADYIDSDHTPTSDVAATSWKTTTTHPTYTGNEKTPYINQLDMAITLKADASAPVNSTVPGSSPAEQQITQTLKFDATATKVDAWMELINIYKDQLTSKSAFIKGVTIDYKVTLKSSESASNITYTAGENSGTNGEYTGTFTADFSAAETTVPANSYEMVTLTTSTKPILPEYTVVTRVGTDTTTDKAPALTLKVECTKISFDQAIIEDGTTAGTYVDYVKGWTTEIKESTGTSTGGTGTGTGTGNEGNTGSEGGTEGEGGSGEEGNTGNEGSTDGEGEEAEDTNASLDMTIPENVFSGSSSKTFALSIRHEVEDPRCNLTKAQGKWTTTLPGSGWKDAPTAVTSGQNENSNAKNDNLAEEKDLEPNEDPKDLSSAYIRNGAMQSIAELGFIHRGKPWQTINLRSAPADAKLNDNTDKLPYLHDVKILEKYRLGSLDNDYKFNVNHPSNLSGAFAPLTEKLSYNTLTGTATTLTDAAKKSLRAWLANKCFNSVGNDPAANDAANTSDTDDNHRYNRYVRHSEVANVITDWALKSNDSPIKAAPTDAAIEELVAKIVPLVRFGEMYEYYTLFAVAQTIKDFGGQNNNTGTIHRYNNNGELVAHTAHTGQWDDNVDMITSESYLVARIRRTIGCNTQSEKYLKSCLWGRHNESCTKDVTVLECYTIDP